MGRQLDGGQQSAADVLKEAAEVYGVGDSFDQMVQVHDLSYDSVFRQHLATWDQSVEGLRAQLEVGGGGGFGLPSWLAGISDDEKKFFWTHVVDVVLYRFFPQVFTNVRTLVMRDFVAAVNAATTDAGPPPRVAILAHSLGTAVTHDALAHLTTQPVDGSEAYLSARGWRLDHLFMLANVSRVLSRLSTPFYRSTVRCENAPGDGMPAIRRYLNFQHRLDPIVAVKAFQPAGWGTRYADTVVDHLLEWNVHGFQHYLRHPDIHVPILNRLLDGPVTVVQHREAVERLQEVGRSSCMEVVDRLRTHLRQARDLVASAPDEPEALVKVATQTWALVEQARQDCI
jgi:hypothetical protein